ncbi:MAG TPA: cation-translocating P-type ATPase C-terminal domain-containing protein, partial [Microlunatus sp.]|nr:cation-translocating P-type ATPase C-terminal domain-containing protein [Microlunatus sp.]
VGVAIIAVDPGDPDVMKRPPRDPKITITNKNSVITWIAYAAVLFIAALLPLVAGPDQPSTTQPSVSLTMTFVVMGLGTAWNAVVNRRDPTSGLAAPILKALAIALIPIAMLFLGTQLPTLQQALLTAPLTPRQWLVCFGLSALLPVVVEISKAVRRRRIPAPAPIAPDAAVSPARAKA